MVSESRLLSNKILVSELKVTPGLRLTLCDFVFKTSFRGEKKIKKVFYKENVSAYGETIKALVTVELAGVGFSYEETDNGYDITELNTKGHVINAKRIKKDTLEPWESELETLLSNIGAAIQNNYNIRQQKIAAITANQAMKK